AGTLQLGNGGAGGGLAGNITDNAALIFNRADNFVYGGLLGGSGDLTKQGAGKLTLTGDNSFSGSVTISDGTLALAGGGQLSTPLLNNATFEVSDGAASHTVGAITGTGTTQVLGAGQIISPSITQGTLIIGGAAAAGAGQPIPEPGTFLLLAMAGLAILGAVRRRQ
ncbi:MAG: autotransporter-associated beta strand repeat-containing protein, partial [Pirellulales bacterium]|nr:autotransporter-associated beta strand repeat-containing protein [Pirellulales bacterium]